MNRAGTTDFSANRFAAACDLWNMVPAAQNTGPFSRFLTSTRLAVWRTEHSTSGASGRRSRRFKSFHPDHSFSGPFWTHR